MMTRGERKRDRPRTEIMKAILVGAAAALAVAVLCIALSKMTGWDLDYLAGWWGCVAWIAIEEHYKGSKT